MILDGNDRRVIELAIKILSNLLEPRPEEIKLEPDHVLCLICSRGVLRCEFIKHIEAHENERRDP